MDKDLIDENSILLRARWAYLRQSEDANAYRYLGFSPDEATQLRGLEELQVSRAADVTLPLFRQAITDEALANLLTSQNTGAEPLTEADRVIHKENETWLVNRWMAARRSTRHAQLVFGLSARAIDVFCSATLADLMRACRRTRIANYAAKPNYLFHAGLNPALSQAQRFILAAGVLAARRA